MFKIVRHEPVYHPVYDGIVGSVARTLPNTYETYACACAFAARLADDDDYCEVVYAATGRTVIPAADRWADEEIPF